ncbi:MAG: sigma-70 family RNA polymerase sigma factor [Oscillospiraceae bacterium]|nr:sigma-70 family RNA polymerase sigma factor [Oscillospiraceae bacterium]
MEHGAECYRRYLAGDESAFSEIIAEFRDPVTFFIQRYVRDLCAAEDIAADVFMDLVVHRHKYRSGTSFRTYLFVLARSRSLDYLRKMKRRTAVPLEDAEGWLSDEHDLEEEVLQGERARMLHEAIAKLPPEQQIAVHLVYFEDRSYEDTARIMKKSKKQVDNLLYRAKQSLRNIIGEEGAQRL